MDEQTPGENEIVAQVHPDFWMYRPCGVYLDEYTECKSWKARYHQRYVNGKEADCTQWKTDHENCVKFNEKYDFDTLEKLLESEKARRARRLEGAKGNTVWEYRTSPPENWAAPLPPHLQKIKVDVQTGEDGSKKRCVIS